MKKTAYRGSRLFASLLGTMFAMSIFNNGAQAAETTKQLKMPDHIKVRKSNPNNEQVKYDPDLLLVMPKSGAEQEDIDKAFEDAHGTVIGYIGDGALKCYIVRTEKNKLGETEKKLGKDTKNFRCVGRNYKLKAHFVPNDTSFPAEWHLAAINAPKAWDRSMGASTKVAVFDTGCQASITDLNGKTQKGYDATTLGARLTVLGGPGLLGDLLGGLGGALSSGAKTDPHGHGTWVATTACATANNTNNTAGVSPQSTVYPVRIAGSDGTTDDIAIMAGLLNMMSSGNRIVNISYGAPPPFGLTNALVHAPMHVYMQTYHDLKGGLIFMSSGNDSAFDPNPKMHYVNVVTAVDPSLTLTDFSNYGLSSTFTAPGKGIVCSDTDGTVTSVDGTSFSSPIAAAVAALVWNANPTLPNVAVEGILKASCFKAGSAPWTPYYGFGMPDANKAVRMARGGF
jgi:thermitase